MELPRKSGQPDKVVYSPQRRSKMAKKRRRFSRELKIEAVKLVTQQGQSVAEAARSLGIGENQLRSWKQALAKECEDSQQAFPGHGNRPALEAESHRRWTE